MAQTDTTSGSHRLSPNEKTAVADTPTTLTVFGCADDEAAVFRERGTPLGIEARVVREAVCEANAELAAGGRCVSVSHRTPITSGILRALGAAGVEYVSTRSVGHDHIDMEAAERLGIAVGTVAYSPDSVADHALMLMLMLTRDAKSTLARTGSGDYRLGSVRGTELRDLCVGVVGTGRIGSAVIDRLRGFGCRVLAHDIRPRPVPGADVVALDELLERSGIVTLHTPLTPQTHHLVNSRRIERMTAGAYVVNTGRGALLDTEALLAGLEGGRLGGAALDVVEGEERVFSLDCRGRPTGHRLLERLQALPNVVITPHSGYYTEHALNDTVENTLAQCIGFEWVGRA